MAKNKPKLRIGQVLLADSCIKYPRTLVYVDAIHFHEGIFYYQDAAVTATVGIEEDKLRPLTRKERGERSGKGEER